jgi:hypothetical protein
MVKIKLNDLEIDTDWSYQELELFLKENGERANIAVDKMVITDCGDDGIKLGFKIKFDDNYPIGKIIEIDSYKFSKSLNRIIKNGIIWQKE